MPRVKPEVRVREGRVVLVEHCFMPNGTATLPHVFITFADGTQMNVSATGHYQFIMGDYYKFTLLREINSADIFDGIIQSIEWLDTNDSRQR